MTWLGKSNVVIVDTSFEGGANFVLVDSVLVAASTNQTSFFFDDFSWDFPWVLCLVFILYQMCIKLWIQVNCVQYAARLNLKENFSEIGIDEENAFLTDLQKLDHAASYI